MGGSSESRVESPIQEDDTEESSRVQYSCWACRKSKVRCDRHYSCGRCVRFQQSCVMQTRGRGPSTKVVEGGESFNSEDYEDYSSNGEDDLHPVASNARHEEDILLQQQQQEEWMRMLGGKERRGGRGEEKRPGEEEQEESCPPQHDAAAAVDPPNLMNVYEVADEPTTCHYHRHHHYLDNHQQPALGSPGTDGVNDDDSSDDEPAGPPIIFDTNGSLSGHWADVGFGRVVEGETSYTGGYASKDGGPAPWQMTGGLRSPIGIQHHDHCRAAAVLFGETAHRVFQQGMLQHRKALAVIRTWDVYSYRHGVDIACGASEALLRVLTMAIPEDSIVSPQEEVPSDPSLTTRSTEELLNPAYMPPYVAQLKIDQSAATCGYVYANGHYRLWVNDEFSIRFFTADEANGLFTQMSILPCYIYGNMVSPKDRPSFYTRLMEYIAVYLPTCLPTDNSMISPKDRPSFYSRLMEYLLTQTDETQEMSMVVETVEVNRQIHASLVRVRYMVMNDGQYACLALSIQRLYNEVKEIVRDEEWKTIGPPLHQRPVMMHQDTSFLSSLSYISCQAPTLSWSSSSFPSYSSSSCPSSLTSSYTIIPSYVSESSSAAESNSILKDTFSPPSPNSSAAPSSLSPYDINHQQQQQQHPKYAIYHDHVAAVPPSYCPPPPPPLTPLPLPYHHQHSHHLASRPLKPLPLSTPHRQHHPYQQPQQQQQNPLQQQNISQPQHWIQPREYLVPSPATYQ